MNTAVFDDDFGKDDSLGSKTLDTHSIQEQRQGLSQWIPLENCELEEVLLSTDFVHLKTVQKANGIESTVKPNPTKEALKQMEPTVKDAIETKDSKVVRTIVQQSNEKKKVTLVPNSTISTETIDETKNSKVVTTIVQQSNEEKKNKDKVNIAVSDDDVEKDDSLGIQKAKGIDSTVKPNSTKEAVKQIEPTVKDAVEDNIQNSTITKKIVEESETTKIPKKDFVSETKERTQVIVKDSNVRESVVTSPTPTNPFEAGQLLLTNFTARDIEKKDTFGKADPNISIVATEDDEKDGHLDFWITQKKNKSKEERFYQVETETEQIVFIKPHKSQMLCNIEKLTFLY